MRVQFSWDGGIRWRLKSLVIHSEFKRWWNVKVWQLLSCSTSWNCFLPEVACDLTKPFYSIWNVPIKTRQSHVPSQELGVESAADKIRMGQSFYVTHASSRTLMGRQILLGEGRVTNLLLFEEWHVLDCKNLTEVQCLSFSCVPGLKRSSPE